MNTVAVAFMLFTAGLLAYLVTWLWQDYRAFSRAYDARRVWAMRDEYLEARRRHAAFQGLRVIRGGGPHAG